MRTGGSSFASATASALAMACASPPVLSVFFNSSVRTLRFASAKNLAASCSTTSSACCDLASTSNRLRKFDASSSAGLLSSDGRPMISPYRLATTSQSSCRFGRMPILRPIRVAATTMAVTAR